VAIYIIENESTHMTSYPSTAALGEPTGAETFSTESELAELAAGWPMTRLVGIWSALSNVTPLKKFTDRKTAITRIWSALQIEGTVCRQAASPITESEWTKNAQDADSTHPVAADVDVTPISAVSTEQGPDVALLAAHSSQQPRRRKKLPFPARNGNGSPQATKAVILIDLMKRPGGVTLQELLSVTGWQTHSIRGFISGTLGKKMALRVVSKKGEAGERTYSIGS
jgi:hypothetical protein